MLISTLSARRTFGALGMVAALALVGCGQKDDAPATKGGPISLRRLTATLTHGPFTIDVVRAAELLRGQAPSEELFEQAGQIASENARRDGEYPDLASVRDAPDSRPSLSRDHEGDDARPTEIAS